MEATRLLVFLLLALAAPPLAALREFHYVNLLKTWTEAQSYCREKMFDLATVESADDWARVRDLVAASGQADVWIGLYDDVRSWRWSLDGSSLYDRPLGSWFVMGVDNDGGQEHCATLWQGGVYDRSCDLTRKSVCYDESSSSYIRDETTRTWWAARRYCRRTYTDMASARNQWEWNKVGSLIGQSGGWIGLSREAWKWSDQSDSTFRLWLAGEPSGGPKTCGAASGGGMLDAPCDDERTFICSAPQRKVLKVTLKTNGSVNLSDPLVQEAALMQMEEDLRGQLVPQEFSLSWRKQPHGHVFNQTELEDV